jgi:hypothetical protein
MNFGTLKNIFLEKLIESHISKDKSGSKMYKKYLKLIKENESLKTAFIVFKNIETKTIKNELMALDYLKECKSLFDNYKGENSLKENIKKLTNLLDEYGVEYSNKETTPLHESLQKYFLTKKTVTSLDMLQESQNTIVEWLKQEKEVINEESDFLRDNVDPKKFLKIATEKYNEKYDKVLTEEEKNILKVLKENNEDEIKELVSGLVKENIDIVNYLLKVHNNNIELKSKLLETKETIYKMMEDNNSFNEKVLKLYELKSNLKND